MKKPTLKQRHAILLRACRKFVRGCQGFMDDDEIMYPFEHPGFALGADAIDTAVAAEARGFAPKKAVRVPKFPKK